MLPINLKLYNRKFASYIFKDTLWDNFFFSFGYNLELQK